MITQPESAPKYQELEDDQLTEEQQYAISEAVRWATNPKEQILTIGGRAGTGKSTLIKKIRTKITELKCRTAVGAFTGKAVANLRQKGVTDARTLHSMIYILEGQDPGTRRPQFKKSPFKPADIVIVDEASFVGKSIDQDIRSYPGIKILYIGDHWQLAPIEEDPGLMKNPQIRLEQIHRQAEHSEIVQFATHLHYETLYPKGRYLFQPRVSDELEIANVARFFTAIKETDIALVGRNETRHKTNQILRQHHGHEGPTPQPGERVICLRNSSEYGVFNGLIGTVTGVRGSNGRVIYLDLEDDIGTKWQGLPALIAQFGQDSMAAEAPWDVLLFDFGNALTVHKAQGSEWDTVTILEESVQDWARWCYTAATRGAKKVIYCR